MAEVGSARRTGPADATGTTPVGRRGPLRNTWPDRWSLEFSERGFVSTEVQQKAALPSVGPGLIRPGRPAGRGSAGASEGPTRGAKGIPKRPDRESVARWRIRVRTDPGPTERSPRTGTDRALCIDLKRSISPGIIAIRACPRASRCRKTSERLDKTRRTGVPRFNRKRKRANRAGDSPMVAEHSHAKASRIPGSGAFRPRRRALRHHRIPDPNSTRSISSCFAWMLSFS